jgi:signal recognition particle subunit SRP54
VSGVVLTRMDGDGRGGAALSMRAVTGKPIRFVGLGEKLDALESFDPARVAGRILGMGDIVALVERAQQTFEAEQAERMMKRFQKGLFNMNDLKMQLDQMLRMGGIESVMGMMPGMNKMQKQAAEAGLDDRMIRRQIALINSMTKKERANPDLLQASRKKRIAAGAGLEVAELNRLLKQHRQMADMMKKLGAMGKGGMLKQAVQKMFGKGGPSEADIAAAQASMAQGKMPQLPQGMQLPKGFGGANPFGGAGLPQGLSGLMKKK